MKTLKRLGWGIIFLIPFCLLPTLLQAQPSPGDPWTFPPSRLDSWSFQDTNNWTSDFGYAPIGSTNLSVSQAGNIANSVSLVLDSVDPAWLQYNVYETNGATNLTVDTGTVTLWFSPSWASATTNQNGTGPGVRGRLLEAGAYTDDASYGWWSLYFDEGGTNVYFSAQTNSGDWSLTTYLSAPIDWASNTWHMLTLTYTATNSGLYIDGVLTTNGPGVTIFPGADVLTNGFFIGSDSTGTNQAHGIYDDIYTWNYPLDTNQITGLYNYFFGWYSMNPFNFDRLLFALTGAPSSSSYSPTVTAIYGGGYAQSVGPASAVFSGTNVWISNVVARVVSTQAVTVSFDIQGGYDNLLYDIFGNAVMTPGNTNFQWAWLGQGYHGMRYSITNMQIASTFFQLGTPVDSDGDGYTDAYENLILHTATNNSHLSGDGLSDLYKIQHGLTLGGVVAVPALSAVSVSSCPVP